MKQLTHNEVIKEMNNDITLFITPDFADVSLQFKVLNDDWVTASTYSNPEVITVPASVGVQWRVSIANATAATKVYQK